MRHGDTYTHFKGNDYTFDCIALPKQDKQIAPMVQEEMLSITKATHHDSQQLIPLYKSGAATYIDAPIPYVIYQSTSGVLYAREVDDFFGYAVKEHGTIQRFTKKESKE